MRWSMLIVLLLIGTTFLQADDRPNIIVIVADDLGYADVGFQGAKDIPTPRLDQLAKSGVVCTSGYVTHPFCSPTRAALLTGRYQQRFGHENNPRWLPEDKQVGLPLDQTTLADVLKGSGYKTGCVGKWHLGAHPSFHPNRRGFTEYFGHLGGGHNYLDHNQFQTNPMKAKQEYFIPILRNEEPVEVNEYLTNVFGQEAAAFIEKNKDDPFFLYLAFNAPHTPLQAAEKFLDRVKAIQDPKRRTYAAMICALDDAIGTVLDKLKEHDLTKETLIFFFSDNGGPVGVTNCSNTPLKGAKGQLYEGGIRVPFVVSFPGLLKPGTHSQPVSSLDVFSTAVAIAEAPLPKGLKLDGENLLSLIKNTGKAQEHRTLYWRTNGGDGYAIRHGDMKMIKIGKRPAELYDLKPDIAEEHNIAEKNADRIGSLQKMLDEWNDQLLPPKWPPLQQPPKKEKP
jgi:arylsulfatase A-like enzyme